MLKKFLGPVLLALAIAGAAGGVTYAATSSHSGSSPSTNGTSAQVQATPTATTRPSCPHAGSAGAATSGFFGGGPNI